MNVTKCPPRAAAGIHKVKRGAMYKMGETIVTIAPAFQQHKPRYAIAPPRWVYRASRVNVLRKGPAHA